MNFPEPDVTVTHRDDGTILFRCDIPIDPYEPDVYAMLTKQASTRPDARFVGQRINGGDWTYLTYGEVDRKARSVGQGLLNRGFKPGEVILILSENTLEHCLLMFGCYAAQVAAAATSPGYSLQSTTFDKLTHVFELTTPRAIFVQDGARFAKALSALDLGDTEIIAAENAEAVGATPLDDLIATEATDQVQASIDGITPDTVAKILFTSGSTGMPKGVIQSHGMLASNAAMAGTVRRIPTEGEDYQILDWLPWSHSFGANTNFNGCLRKGGIFHIDGGKPLPGAFDETIENLRTVSPSLFSTTPSAFAMLITAMEQDKQLRANFFKHLAAMSFGGAALPADLYERMQNVAIEEMGQRILFMSGYGATETGPTITLTYFETDRVGLLGLPLPGTTIKMVPHGDTYELRFKAPSITPGYYKQPDKTAEAFDEEGYYKIGDAGKFVDPNKPELGLLFDGRVAEEFKLLTGTWVSVGKLRTGLLAACSPLLRDAVIAGQDENYISALAWPNEDKVRALAGLPADAPLADVLASDKVRAAIADGLAAYNKANPASSTRIEKLVLLEEEPSADGHEITDKGYINQRATLTRRANLVEALYADAPDDRIIKPAS